MVHMGSCNVVWNYKGAIKPNWLLNHVLSYKQENSGIFAFLPRLPHQPAHMIPELQNDSPSLDEIHVYIWRSWKIYLRAAWRSLLEWRTYINCNFYYSVLRCLMQNMRRLSLEQMTKSWAKLTPTTPAESTPTGGVSFTRNVVDGICWDVTAGFAGASALLPLWQGIKMFECQRRCEINEAL